MDNNTQRILDKITTLKTKRNAIILAHNYQPQNIQDIADYVGDSLDLSRQAAETTADVIVMCGVHFMAEGAAILAPDKTVLLPHTGAGCPLADMVTVDNLRAKKAEHPDAVVVTYINSSAANKAESHICVTSSNALQVVNSLNTRQILFVPDMNLGQYVAEQTSTDVILWPGYCPTHDIVRAEDVAAMKAAYPDAAVIVHPECRPEVTAAADAVLSTAGIVRFARESDYQQLIIGTEQGLLYRLQTDSPDKTFHLLHPDLICPNMKLITLDHVVTALETLKPRITVPDNVREAAHKTLIRMLAVT